MTPDFSKHPDGLIPVIIQDHKTMVVLMLGYMNEEAFKKTQEDQMVCFYSRSKNRLWIKGETSGNYMHVKSIQLDCDNDTLLIKVDPVGPVCHKGTDSCWGEVNQHSNFILELEDIIHRRVEERDSSSYTVSLIEKGINKVAQKVGEEGVEVVIEATNGTRDRLINESADLIYHLLVLLRAKELPLQEIADCLKERHNKK